MTVRLITGVVLGLGAALVAASGSRSGGSPTAGHPGSRPGASITFNRDIAPILRDHCWTCHRPGEVAPFSLTSFRDAATRARLIAEVTRRHVMPPWNARQGPETFVGARVLTPGQIDLIGQWAAHGAPEGPASAHSAPPRFPTGWALGPPDLIVSPVEAYTLGAEGRDVYRCFVIPTSFKEPRYVSAIEVRPGNRAVVHHVIVYLDTSRRARQLDAADPGPGYTSFGGVGFVPAGSLGGWAPGISPRRLPDGIGSLLPAGADLVLQVHYHKDGKSEHDRTRVGIYFSKVPVDKRSAGMLVLNPFLRLPAGSPSTVIKASGKVPADVTLMSITPHMHLLGRRMRVQAYLPDGQEKELIDVPDWDFNWQTIYAYRNPVHLPKGTRVVATAEYDNSAANPRNPNRLPGDVHWGEQTTDEMCVCFLGYTVDAEHLTRGIRSPYADDWLSAIEGRRPSRFTSGKSVPPATRRAQ